MIMSTSKLYYSSIRSIAHFYGSSQAQWERTRRERPQGAKCMKTFHFMGADFNLCGHCAPSASEGQNTCFTSIFFRFEAILWGVDKRTSIRSNKVKTALDLNRIHKNKNCSDSVVELVFVLLLRSNVIRVAHQSIVEGKIEGLRTFLDL